ncbi:FERM, ARHGEF and pleckstrin domain-containing protein 2 isoform X2 [Parasteatoda tepidariorum]|uniref:FERM, ARHGEF and pleckstrin domain-containing protein 2 isoform X2 n=1 Tax=Parasteatoda tepidariorum TaxID=114398 RepID=UPI00077FAFBC|nr:FERM, ARHGEF and pleckstrin domain-containing protein 2 isoform X2 [Parasteatoda tepidariorum]
MSFHGGGGASLPHSHSSPSGMYPIPSSPENRNVGKRLPVQVHFLDDSCASFNIQFKAMGRVLFDQVCKMLNLLETDYFGLEYVDCTGTKFWLDYEKPICRQMGLSMINPIMCFCVKFYTPDPAQLEEEYTRYLFSLQIKRDLAQGILLCNDNTAALMASYIVQAECGDFVSEDYPDHTYVASFMFVPHQDAEFQHKIMENHKKHIGQSPAEADLNLLETSRRCELYGIKMTPAKDSEGVPLNLAAAHMGVLVFQNFTKINTFSWAKIRKISFKRRKFLIKLHPEGYGYYKDTVEFVFESRNECKNFWKKCIENHAFFRCSEVKRLPRQKTRIFSRGSSFRYSGRTQKQMVEYVRENYVKRQPFQRSTSLRVSSTNRRGLGLVGVSLSAQPLLPVSSSQSCGSVILSHDLEMPPAFLTRPTSASQPSSPRVNQDSSRMMANGSICIDSRGSYSERRDLPPAKDLSSPVSQPRSSSNIHSETTSISTRCISSDEEMSRSPTSPLRSLREQCSTAHSPRSETDTEVRRKRIPADKAYFISKELLMTERTYKKDLELINVWFRDEVSKEENMPTQALAVLFGVVDPLYEFHCSFLRELEHRLATWEGRTGMPLQTFIQGPGDIFLKKVQMTEFYTNYIEKLPYILEKLNSAYYSNTHFERMYCDFEMQRVCYLPLTSFLLRPAHRLLHYSSLMERLVEHYGDNHPDSKNCKTVLAKLKQVTNMLIKNIHYSANFVKLMELQRDLFGIDNLTAGRREFLREGCLQKLSKKGYQNRMFFLFSDVLLYANRGPINQHQFKIHGQLPLQGIVVEETESRMGVPHCFTIYGNNRALMVAASLETEKQKWLIDLNETIQGSKESHDDALFYSSLRSCSSSEDLLQHSDNVQTTEAVSATGSSGKPYQHFSNTTVHVCWHRNTTVGKEDYTRALLNYLSGYLLRKFKNSSGWQKLWVVFTNFCLFFYKSYQDDFPLASLPLVGYTITLPCSQDNINKDNVFKLQFKNHVYFFRAESDYTFERWVDVIKGATLRS